MDINTVKDQYTCQICQNIFTDPVKLSICSHIFCKNCIDNYTNTQNINSTFQCPLCRTPFSINEIIQDINFQNTINKLQIKCECGSIMTLNEYKSHSDACAATINKMNEEMKKGNIKIQQDKIQKNRQTFDCTLCSMKNFDRVGYIDHIKKYHPNDRGVCSICKCQPWGDPNYKTHIFGHINLRHKFDYDTVVDYNDEEDEILKRVLLESMNDK